MCDILNKENQRNKDEAMNCIHLLLLLLTVKIVNITEPIDTKSTKLSKKHRQKISAKSTCILALVGIKCPKFFQKKIDFYFIPFL